MFCVLRYTFFVGLSVVKYVLRRVSFYIINQLYYYLFLASLNYSVYTGASNTLYTVPKIYFLTYRAVIHYKGSTRRRALEVKILKSSLTAFKKKKKNELPVLGNLRRRFEDGGVMQTLCEVLPRSIIGVPAPSFAEDLPKPKLSAVRVS